MKHETPFQDFRITIRTAYSKQTLIPHYKDRLRKKNKTKQDSKDLGLTTRREARKHRSGLSKPPLQQPMSADNAKKKKKEVQLKKLNLKTSTMSRYQA